MPNVDVSIQSKSNDVDIKIKPKDTKIDVNFGSYPAKMYALEAEGYATGEQEGKPVSSSSLYYENNAKYYSKESEKFAELAEYAINNMNVEFSLLPADSQPTVTFDIETISLIIGLPQNLIYVTLEEYEQMRQAGTLDPNAYYAVGGLDN